MVSFRTFLNSKRFSNPSRTQLATLNAVASALEYGARLIVGFLINPILVAGLGDYGYGVWQILGRLVAYMTPASGRPTQALKWTLANRQASVDFHEKRRQVGSAMIVWLIFLPVLALIGSGLIWFTPTWLSTSAEFTPIVRLVVAILSLDLIMTTLSEVPHSVLQGENLGYKRMGLSALLIFFGAGLLVVALYFKTGLVGVAIATLIATMVTGYFYYQVVRTYVPWFGMERPLPGAIRHFLGLSSWFLVWNLVSQLMRASDVVILGVFASAELVTTYTLTKYVPETVIMVVEIMVLGIAPGLGGIIGSGDYSKALKIRNELMSYSWLLITIIGSAVLIWNRSFTQLWVGSQHYAGAQQTLLIMLSVLQLVLIRNDANFIDLTLKMRDKVLVGLFSTLISLGIATLFVHTFNGGITGLCLGLIIGRAILSFAYPWLIGRYLGVELGQQLRHVVVPLVVLIVIFTGSSIASEYWVVDSWIKLVGAVGLTVIVVTPLTVFGGLTGEQRSLMWQRVKLLLARS